MKVACSNKKIAQIIALAYFQTFSIKLHKCERSGSSTVKVSTNLFRCRSLKMRRILLMLVIALARAEEPKKLEKVAAARQLLHYGPEATYPAGPQLAPFPFQPGRPDFPP